MPRFKEMSAEEIRAILDAKNESGEKLFEDVLTPLVEKERQLFSDAKCPKCGAGAPVPTLNARRPFTPQSPLPNRVLRCVVCQTEFDPHTGLILHANIIYG